MCTPAYRLKTLRKINKEYNNPELILKDNLYTGPGFTLQPEFVLGDDYNDLATLPITINLSVLIPAPKKRRKKGLVFIADCLPAAAIENQRLLDNHKKEIQESDIRKQAILDSKRQIKPLEGKQEDETMENSTGEHACIDILTPSFNKNNTLKEYEHERKTGKYTIEKAKVTDKKAMTTTGYDDFCDNLLTDRDWLAGKGGADSSVKGLPEVEFFHELTEQQQESWQEKSYTMVVEITAPDRETLYINPEGYNYARYVSFSLETSTPILAERERLEQEIKKAEDEAWELHRITTDETKESNKRRGKELLSGKIPEGTKAVIVASLHRNESDLYADYHGHSTRQEIIIGWSKHTMDLFSEMRKAALHSGFDYLKHLTPGCNNHTAFLVWDHDHTDTLKKENSFISGYDEPYYKGQGIFFGSPSRQKSPTFNTEHDLDEWITSQKTPAGTEHKKSVESYEHREKYSMGGGFYLKNGHRDIDGWCINKRSVNIANDSNLNWLYELAGQGNICIGEPKSKKRAVKKSIGATTCKKSEPVDDITVKINKEKNGIEIYFPAKPDSETRQELKDHKFRWSRFNSCWYHKNDPGSLAFAQNIVGMLVEEKEKKAEVTEAQVCQHCTDLSCGDPLNLIKAQIKDRDNIDLTRNDYDILADNGFDPLEKQHHISACKECGDTIDNETGYLCNKCLPVKEKAIGDDTCKETPTPDEINKILANSELGKRAKEQYAEWEQHKPISKEAQDIIQPEWDKMVDFLSDLDAPKQADFKSKLTTATEQALLDEAEPEKDNLPQNITPLIKKLKENNQDHEFYPTTQEIINIIKARIPKNSYGEISESILDVGAGNGSTLSQLTNGDKYAIEKSEILVKELTADIFTVGCDFLQNSIIDKKVDIVFSNPPYSQYKEWSVKLINEANSGQIFLVLPERWKNQESILDAIKDRAATYTIIGNTDFLEADRKARAKVDIIKIDLKGKSYYSGTSSPDIDPFDLWVSQEFPLNDRAENSIGGDTCKNFQDQINELVPARGLVPAMVELYQNEMQTLQNNFRAISQLDQAIFKELQIDFKSMTAFLKSRIKGLKEKYWRELFTKFEPITERLTKKSRESLLATLTENISVDFDELNIYSVTTWAIKNANKYFDSQLVDVFTGLADKANLVKYKSNQKTWGEDGWRFIQDMNNGKIKHFGLDYRCIIECRDTFSTVGYTYSYTNGLNNSVHDRINDIMTIANNLGFTTLQGEDSLNKEWEPGQTNDFYTTTDGILMSVKAYKNGNIHIKFNQKFLRKLNVEFGRLKGWLRNHKQAAEELNIQEVEAQEYFKGNFALECSSSQLLLEQAA